MFTKGNLNFIEVSQWKKDEAWNAIATHSFEFLWDNENGDIQSDIKIEKWLNTPRRKKGDFFIEKKERKNNCKLYETCKHMQP